MVPKSRWLLAQGQTRLCAEAPLVLFVGDSTARLLYVAFVHVHMH